MIPCHDRLQIAAPGRCPRMKPIWIADDDHAIRFVLEKALAREGLAARSFTNARDVLAALDDSSPQVLVTDIRMPAGRASTCWPRSRSACPACRSS